MAPQRAHWRHSASASEQAVPPQREAIATNPFTVAAFIQSKSRNRRSALCKQAGVPITNKGQVVLPGNPLVTVKFTICNWRHNSLCDPTTKVHYSYQGIFATETVEADMPSSTPWGGVYDGSLFEEGTGQYHCHRAMVKLVANRPAGLDGLAEETGMFVKKKKGREPTDVNGLATLEPYVIAADAPASEWSKEMGNLIFIADHESIPAAQWEMYVDLARVRWKSCGYGALISGQQRGVPLGAGASVPAPGNNGMAPENENKAPENDDKSADSIGEHMAKSDVTTLSSSSAEVNPKVVHERGAGPTAYQVMGAPWHTLGGSSSNLAWPGTMAWPGNGGLAQSGNPGWQCPPQPANVGLPQSGNHGWPGSSQLGSVGWLGNSAWPSFPPWQGQQTWGPPTLMPPMPGMWPSMTGMWPSTPFSQAHAPTAEASASKCKRPGSGRPNCCCSGCMPAVIHLCDEEPARKRAKIPDLNKVKEEPS